jgi:hypothetical protein
VVAWNRLRNKHPRLLSAVVPSRRSLSRVPPPHPHRLRISKLVSPLTVCGLNRCPPVQLLAHPRAIAQRVS